jgi:hypothetical protein
LPILSRADVDFGPDKLLAGLAGQPQTEASVDLGLVGGSGSPATVSRSANTANTWTTEAISRPIDAPEKSSAAARLRTGIKPVR